MKPMLPSRYARSRITYPCYIQPKVHGTRALYQLGQFQFCDQLPDADVSDPFLSQLGNALKKIFPAKVILDGVLTEEGYQVFDVVDFRRPFASRFTVPASILTDTQYLHPARPVETHRILSEEPVKYFYEKWLRAGHQGLIYRLNNCPYICGKSKDLVKRERKPALALNQNPA
jgi:hypothetical protein